jgi:membrane-associated phospholipid phosphatase
MDRQARDFRFWIAIAVSGVAAALFAAIAASVWADAPVLQLDLEVSVWLHAHRSPAVTAFMLTITRMHATAGILLMAAIVALYLWHRGERYWLMSIALAVPGGLVLNALVKHVFNRARPVWDDPLLTLASSSFPSGHTAGATVLYGFLAAYLGWRMKSPSTRVLAAAGCALMVALVGFSRVYLGVHYLSDVLAAASLSTVWLVFCLAAVRA